MDKYEVVVIGAGPAGSTAASLLARNNVHSLIIEKQDLPRQKTCGGALTEKAVQYNSRIMNVNLKTDEIDSPEKTKTDTFQLNFRKEEMTRFTSPETVYFFERKDFDFYLYQNARKQGVDSIVGDGVKRIDFKNNRLELQSGKTIQYKYLFAADGIHSPTRKSLIEENRLNPKKWSTQLAIGIEAYVPKQSVKREFKNLDSIQLHLGVVNWGYGWVFPHKHKLIVGLGGLKTKNNDIRSQLYEYGRLLGIEFKKNYIRGHPFPFGNFLKDPFYKNVLLLGDAGGFADPLTGEGIYYAQRTGEFAARAFLKNSGKYVGHYYRDLVRDEIIPDFIGTRRLRHFIYGAPDWLKQYFVSFGEKIMNPKKIKTLVTSNPFNWSPKV